MLVAETLLLAVVLAAAPTPPDAVAVAGVPTPPDVMMGAMPPPPDVMMGAMPPPPELVLGAMPTPPDKVERVTRSYGVVTLDHKAHLARRTPCASCHGPGRVGKIDFTPKQAHDACRGCHQDVGKGPVACRDCHVLMARTPPEPAPAAPAEAKPSPSHEASAGAAAPQPPPSHAAPPAGAAAGAAAVAAPSAAAPAPSPTAPPPAAAPPAAAPPAAPPPPLLTRPVRAARPQRPAPPPPPEQPRERSIAFAAALPPRGGPGVSLTFRARFERYELTQLVGRHGSSGGGAMTTAFLGAGRSLAVHRGIRLDAAGLVGLVAADRPPVMVPALGATIGAEWPVRPGLGLGLTLVGSQAARIRSDTFPLPAGGRTVSVNAGLTFVVPFRRWR